MSGNELCAALGALLNGEDPETGDEVEFDDHTAITAECAGQKFTVTGYRIVDGRMVLDMTPAG